MKIRFFDSNVIKFVSKILMFILSALDLLSQYTINMIIGRPVYLIPEKLRLLKEEKQIWS